MSSPLYAALVAESGSDPLAEREVVAAAEALLAEMARSPDSTHRRWGCVTSAALASPRADIPAPSRSARRTGPIRSTFGCCSGVMREPYAPVPHRGKRLEQVSRTNYNGV